MRLLTCLAALVFAGVFPLRAAPSGGGPTAPVDATERHTRFAPAPGGTTPREIPRLPAPSEQRAPEAERLELWTRERTTAAIQDDRAAIDVTETRAKDVRPLQTHERKELPRQEATVSQRDVADRFDPTAQRKVYPNADRYNVALRAATAASTQKTPRSLERTGFAEINRFVFRRSRPTTPADAIPATPAGGERSPVERPARRS